MKLRWFTQVMTSQVRPGCSLNQSRAASARLKLWSLPRIQLCSGSKPSKLMATVSRPVSTNSLTLSCVSSIPLVTIPHRYPRCLIWAPTWTISLRTRGSPPVVITTQLPRSKPAGLLSRTPSRSLTGGSSRPAVLRQSLPQWRQLRLQRRVHSQNSWESLCSSTWVLNAARPDSRSSLLAKPKREFIYLRRALLITLSRESIRALRARFSWARRCITSGVP